ncbi:MAG TPA: hypothetical protein VFW23_18310 [Tepidisphaeraceae bacterium]|nr:hypothetical protein [Tepidisphaeraceae bacterium]
MTRDPLEKELEALELPETPGNIRSRIGCAIESNRGGISGRSEWRNSLLKAAAAGLSVAASVLVAIWVIHGHLDRSTGLPRPVATAIKGDMGEDHLNMHMTLALYMQAQSKTGAALDSMLNADAARPIGVSRGPMLRAGSQSLDDLEY